MGVRIPTQTIADFTSTSVGETSIATQLFQIPQDTNGLVVKVQVASISGTNPVAQVFLQTSDDGGTTYFDVLRLPDVTGTTVANASAVWGAAPVFGMGMRSTVSPAASTESGTTQVSVLTVTGNASAFGLSAGQNSGLPILGIQNRVAIRYTGTIATNTGVRVKVLASSQSPS